MTISLDGAAALRAELNQQIQAGAHEAVVSALSAALRAAEGGRRMTILKTLAEGLAGLFMIGAFIALVVVL